MLLCKMVSEWWMKKGVDSRKLSHFMDYLEQHECLAAVESISHVDYYFSDRFSLWDVPEVYVMLRFRVSVNSKCTSQHKSTKLHTILTFSWLRPTELRPGPACQHCPQITGWPTVFISNCLSKFKRIELLKLIESIMLKCEGLKHWIRHGIK